ncbi:alkene reductase [Donghicola mangrovi]|uniref:Alkene reductase n=1 Tax=Donghicola mangrovi TaxID=2729614 RepID=A0A850Q9A8_9RHOB|nr:alkene reductase [Donghicola mangrovi]NVO23548.1 alkene reductase [Donghicola mangrovi]
MTDTLFTSFTAGKIKLANRVVMAPLTRNRADDVTQEVNDLHVEYYRQRAGAGLIITEATNISPEGRGYIQTPGIFTDGQIAAWKKVTDAVHAAGGKIVVQLWHVGRISHTSIQPAEQPPVAPSAIAAGVKTFTKNGFEDTSTPRALETDEMTRVISDYAHATRCAKEAGFDGVEVHAANGYLIDQFLKDGSNKREDRYGGSVANRTRLLFEVLNAVVAEWDEGHVGLRLSPFSNANGVSDSDPMATFKPVFERLNEYKLAYLHVVEGQTGGARDGKFDELRALYKGTYMGNNGYDYDLAEKRLADGVDLVAFGRPFIANPDLVTRLRKHAPLNEGDKDTYYGGGAKGYTDYPLLDAS